jgi:hypothetical protein
MTGPGRPTLGKSEYREPVHNDCLRGVTNEVPADFFESPSAPSTTGSSLIPTPPLSHPRGAVHSTGGGTSGVAEIAENKFYVARSALLG